MEEIKGKEYVRTADGKIGVFIRYSSRKDDSIYKSPFNCFIRLQNRKSNMQCCREYIVKHSPNLIDLIQCGDYVNGEEVKRINDYGDFKRADFNLDYDDSDAVYEEDIKTIVTKEMMESISYKVTKM